tara:strand:- start:100 stop:303 length:204 start_codon:yes stop_codon:yes gene_type:complete
MRISARQLREGEPTIDDMRRDLAEAETDTLLDNASDITELLLDGFVGLNETPDIEIKDEWNQIFGED